ncbi:MAG: flagellar biosynthesis protein FlhA [Zetaproteobacteria bacterium]|nr:flagellar biosynthesis protein FlhA [Zetaproteobacteria bacterium]
MQQAVVLTLKRIGRHTDVMLAVGVLGILLIMMVPLPLWLMDILLALNIAIGLMILLTSIYVLRPMDFSIFPALLLLTTLFRLSLNVATTRLILLHGQEGPGAAGRVIEGFGSFVVGGNTVVGVIIFIILVLINFIVITKGSTRIAEVAARFTLDAMPGKQMAIDADLNAGMIDEAQARERRKTVASEAEFFGSMDGASKFVRGDAVAGLIITAINLIAGLIIGTAQQGMAIGDAMSVYSLLTVGDGLVSQIPALVISTAAGIVITRASGNDQLATEITTQFTAHPKVHFIAAGALLLISLVPGLPFIPFLLLGLGFGMGGWFLWTDEQEQAAKPSGEDVAPVAAEKPAEASLSELLVVDPLRLEVGYGLIDLIEGGHDGGLLQRLQTLRRQMTQDIGFILPPVHIKDNLQLGVGDYRVLVRGAEVGRSEIRPRQLLALEGQVTGPRMEGIETKEPAFGLPALWIAQDKRQQAELSGYTVVEPSTVIVTHLTEILRKHSSDMLDRAQVKELVDGLSERYPKVIDDIIPTQVSLGMLQHVLRALLSEWVPIRDLLLIIETMADGIGEQRDVSLLVEMVRFRLGRTIVQRYQDGQGELPVFTLDGELEQMMMERVMQPGGASMLPLEIQYWQRFVMRFNEIAAQQNVDVPVLLTTPQLRSLLSQSLSKVMGRVAVISVSEVPSDMGVKTLASLSLRDAG